MAYEGFSPVLIIDELAKRAGNWNKTERTTEL